MIWKKKFLSILVLVVFFGIIVFIFNTSSGQSFVLKHAIRYVPGLSINSINSNGHKIVIKKLIYKNHGIIIKVNECHLSIKFNHMQFLVKNAILKDIYVRVKTKELFLLSLDNKKNSWNYNAFNALFPLILNNLSLNNLKLMLDDTKVIINIMHTGIYFKNNNLIVTPTCIYNLLIISPKVIHPLNNNYRNNFIVPSTSKILKSLFSKSILSVLPKFNTPLNITIKEIIVRDLIFSSNRDFLVTKLCIHMKIYNKKINLSLLEIEFPQGTIHAFGVANFIKKCPVDITINSKINLDLSKKEIIRINIIGNLRENLRINFNLYGPIYTEHLSLKVEMTKKGVPLMISLDSSKIQLSLGKIPNYRMQNIMLCINCKKLDFYIKMKATFSSLDVPITKIIMKGKGNINKYIFFNLKTSSIAGNSDLTTLVKWKDSINWSSKLILRNVNINCHWPRWPSRLTGKINIKGNMISKENWKLQIPFFCLHGNIKENYLNAKGSIYRNSSGFWKIPRLKLLIGKNTLNIKGTLSNTCNLNAVINFPKLNEILPGFRGIINGNIKIFGSINHPNLLVDINAIKIYWKKLTIQHIMLKGNIKKRNNIEGYIYFQANNITQKDFSLQDLILVTYGNEKHHQIHLSINGKQVFGQLNFNGKFNHIHRKYGWILNETELTIPFSEWLQIRNKKINHYNKKSIIATNIYQSKYLNNYFEADKYIIANNSITEKFFLNQFKPSTSQQLLSPNNTLDLIRDILTGHIDTKWTINNDLQKFKLFIVGNDIKIVQKLQENAFLIRFDYLYLNIGIDKDSINFNWRIKILGNSKSSGQLKISKFQSLGLLSGYFSIKNFCLSILNPFLSSYANMNGIINANFVLGGTIDQPKLYGQLKLNKLIIQGSLIPFTMKDSCFIFNFIGNNFVFHGHLSTTHGNLNITGITELNYKKRLITTVKAKGENIRISVPSMLTLDVSPDIIFKAMPNLFLLSGKINIPQGYIKVKNIPQNIIRPSSDEIILDKKFKYKVVNNKIKYIPYLSTNLLLHIGNGVTINAFGLKSSLKGDLRIVHNKKQRGLNGQIDISPGRFHAYGQDLIVRKGQVFFSGQLDQPYLNIEAIRNPDATKDNVTAGFRLTGLFNQLKIEVFSSPAKAQQEALSYFLRGQQLNVSNTDGNIMTSMLIGVGVSKSEKILNNIGKIFGVSGLEIDTQGAGTSSQVVLSGHIAPNLEVNYGIGIFNSLDTLKLRCKLMPKLYLEMIYGIEKAFHLLYHFEF